MCDVIKIRLRRRIASRSGKGNQLLYIKTAVGRVAIFKARIAKFMLSFYFILLRVVSLLFKRIFMTSHMTLSSASSGIIILDWFLGHMDAIIHNYAFYIVPNSIRNHLTVSKINRTILSWTKSGHCSDVQPTETKKHFRYESIGFFVTNMEYRVDAFLIIHNCIKNHHNKFDIDRTILTWMKRINRYRPTACP